MIYLCGDCSPRWCLIHQVEDDSHQISGWGVDSTSHGLDQHLKITHSFRDLTLFPHLNPGRPVFECKCYYECTGKFGWVSTTSSIVLLSILLDKLWLQIITSPCTVGSELRTSPVFKWSKHVWSSNGLLFKPWPEYRTKSLLPEWSFIQAMTLLTNKKSVIQAKTWILEY